MSVGAAIAAALERAAHHQRLCPRRLTVRVMLRYGDHRDRLTVVAHVAARTGEELEAQAMKGIRHILLAELDARAGELVGLVDQCVTEAETAVGLRRVAA